MKLLSFAALAVVMSFGICGNVRAQSTLTYEAFLSGPNESPPNASPGTGFAVVTVNTGYAGTDDWLTVDVSFSGLLGTTTASHIHAATATPGTGTAGVATTTPTFAGFPLGVTSGVYTNTLDLTLASSYNPAYVTANGSIAGAETALLAAIASDEAYLNIHTTVVPGGEIRGFLVPVPEPSTYALAATGAGMLWAAMRRRRG